MSVTRIVIVNYRTAPLVVDCLRSLAAEVAAEPDCRVVVVDNASGDGSVQILQDAINGEGWASWAEILPLDRNLGFSGGNNAALRPLFASLRAPDYVFLLNPDTWVRPGAVRALVEFMERRPDVGIAGSRLEHPNGEVQNSAFRFHTATSEFERGLRLGLVTRLLRRWVVAPPARAEAHPADWLSGASLMIRREVFDSVGLLDEDYFLYYEEVDFCLRARAAGWRCWYVPESRVVHLVGQSSGVTGERRAERRVPRYWFESRSRYFRKNHGRLYATAADLAWSTAFSLWRLRRRIQRRPDPDPPGLLGDFVRFHFVPFARVR